MMSIDPGFAEIVVVLTLILTLIAVFAATVWSFVPGRFKPTGEAMNKLLSDKLGPSDTGHVMNS